MTRTCNQLGYCQRAEIFPCVGDCELVCQDPYEQSKLDRVFTAISWLVIGVTSIAMVAVVIGVIYHFGYDFLTRFG